MPRDAAEAETVTQEELAIVHAVRAFRRKYGWGEVAVVVHDHALKHCVLRPQERWPLDAA